MIQNRISSVSSSSFQNNIKEISSKNNSNIINKKNSNEGKDKNDNDLLSNSGTSIGSNKDSYNNFVSKLKLNYHLNNPQERTQTIILHTSLDKSFSDINDSLTQNDISNQNLNNDLNNNKNCEGKGIDQLNNGFLMDNTSQYSKNVNNLNKTDLNNNKRNTLNNINQIYKNENIIDNSDLNDNNQTDKIKKDKFTINFNNNMFFVNDNNKSTISHNQNFPLDNIFNNFKKTSENTFKNKVFLSNNDFEDNYPGLKNNENNNNNNVILPYGYQNNAFCDSNQNRNIQHIINSQNPTNYNFNNEDNSSLKNLSTNLNTNNDNLNLGQNNNNKGISPFNYGNNSNITNSLQNFGNSLIDLNNNKNKNNDIINKNNKIFSFNSNNNIDKENNNDNDSNNQIPDINYTTKIFPEKKDTNIQNNINHQNDQYENNNNPNDFYENESDENSDNSSIQKLNININYPPNFNNNLIQTHHAENNEFKNDNNNINNNNNNINNYNYNYQRALTFNPNNYNVNYNNKDNIKPENYPLVVNNINNAYKIDNNENINSNSKKYYILRSLLYGLLLGSTTTALFWLRKEETRQYLMEKYSRVNFESIIKLFKSILFPVEFFKKILSKEKREVYLKVLGITFGKFYDFLEKYGDGFRLLGVFLFIYGIWIIIKSLIKMAITNEKYNNFTNKLINNIN